MQLLDDNNICVCQGSSGRIKLFACILDEDRVMLSCNLDAKS